MATTFGAAPAGATDGFTASGQISGLTGTSFEPIGQAFFNIGRRQHFNTSQCQDAGAAEVEAEIEIDLTGIDSEARVNKLAARPIDTADHKKQNHYALMGLNKIRHAASYELIDYQFKQMTLSQHPDKKSTARSTDEDRAQADAYFTCVKMAYEVLSNPKKRILFDSVDVDDEFDEVPKKIKDPVKDQDKFFKKFGAAFARNARWLGEHGKVPPSPPLGDMDISHDELSSFYDFWYKTNSWRTFGYWDKENADNADSREEKRYLEKQNKAERKRMQKEEGSRMMLLIDNAWASDPRRRKLKEDAKAKKEAEAQVAADAKAAEQAAKEEADKAAAEALAASAAASKDTAADLKKAKTAFTKKCKKMKCYKDEDAADDGEVYVTREQTDALKAKLDLAPLKAFSQFKDRAPFMEKMTALLAEHGL